MTKVHPYHKLLSFPLVKIIRIENTADKSAASGNSSSISPLHPISYPAHRVIHQVFRAIKVDILRTVHWSNTRQLRSRKKNFNSKIEIKYDRERSVDQEAIGSN